MMDITNELLQEKKFIAFLCDSAFMRKPEFRPGNRAYTNEAVSYRRWQDFISKKWDLAIGEITPSWRQMKKKNM